MTTRRFVRVVLAVLWCGVAIASWAAPAYGQTPTPTPSAETSNNPFANLEPITLLIWLGSALVALVCVVYAVERERRKHEG
jgi:hypothetical protein